MQKALSVRLRTDINTKDIQNIIKWLNNENVTKYLNESPNAKDNLLYLLENIQSHMLTFHLNRNGYFFLICTGHDDEAIGFIRLIDLPGDRYEVVYVIGEEELWGKGLGKAALSKALEHVFFEKRGKAVLAKISHKNIRSVRTAVRCGMSHVKSGTNFTEYSVTFEDYIKKIV
ncbi:MAG: GNAT family N-acetyltransferase [Eubacteriales bacterium]|jgi:RimJ/RimL family protein N-acetyltransferase